MTVRYETALWQRLSDNGLVSGEAPDLIEDNAPWYVRTMLGIAGWIGALFMLGALFSGFAFLSDSTNAAGVLGTLACLLAIIIYRSIKHNDFMSQFAFAISLAGQGLLVFSVLSGLGLFDGSEAFVSQLRLLALVLAVLQTVLFLMIPNFLHRIWSGVIGIAAIIFLLMQFGLYPFTLPLLLACVALVWLNEFTWAKYSSMIQTLGYSLVFVCIAHLIADSRVLNLSQLWQESFGVTPLGGVWGSYLAALLLGALLIAVAWIILKQTHSTANVKVVAGALLLAGLIAIVGMRAPGITVGLVLVLLGYAHGNKVLTGMGLVTLVAFISQFYYQLNFTLLQKSLLLFFSGLALLGVRQLMHVLWPKPEKNDA